MKYSHGSDSYSSMRHKDQHGKMPYQGHKESVKKHYSINGTSASPGSQTMYEAFKGKT